jgi:hypothetical protein
MRAPKTLMYSAPINDFEVLQQREEKARQKIQMKLGIFDRVRTSVCRRAESWVEMHGNHKEHILWRSQIISHISVGADSWTYIDWEFFVQLSEYYASLKPVTDFLKSCITDEVVYCYV